MMPETEQLKGELVFSDAELVGLAQRGDATSLGVLLERHRALLHALALRMMGHGPQAEDAVHDTFLIALRKIDQVREPAAVGGWLCTVLRNVCYTRLREDRGEIPLDELSLRAERASSEPSAEEYIDRLAMRGWVWTALSELPEVLRVTAILRYFGSYSSYEEIAAILGVPVGTVRSRLSQVKLKLADALLETAGLAHDEARRLTESRTRFFSAAMEEMNRQKGYELMASEIADDLVVVLPGGPALRGREFLIRDVEGDLEVGTKKHLTKVLVSKEVTVLEGTLENPPDDPNRCPPAASQVLFYRGGRIQQMHIYFAPPPSREVEG